MKLTIHNLRQVDLPEVAKLQPEDWPNILPHIEFYLSASFCFPIKMMIDGQLAGIGTAIVHKKTAWLGHIIVHPDFRNKGIGTAVTQALINSLKNSDCTTIQLIATKLGEPVYRKLGFLVDTEYLFFTGEELLNADNTSSSFNESCETDILACDETISGEMRKDLLLKHLPKAHLIIERDKVQGYYLPTLGEGLIVANNAEAGLLLLTLKHTQSRKTAIPVNNIAAADFLTKNGMVISNRGSRMWFGKKIIWQPEKVYSRIGGNLG